MKSYIISLIGVALVCGVAEMLSPEGRGDSLKKSVRMLCGFCILCIAVQPITAVINTAQDLGDIFSDAASGLADNEDKYEEIYNKNILRYGQANASEGLKSMLCEKYGISPDDIDVSVAMREDETSFVAESVTVTLSGKGVLADPHVMLDYVNGLLGCECVIIYQ